MVKTGDIGFPSSHRIVQYYNQVFGAIWIVYKAIGKIVLSLISMNGHIYNCNGVVWHGGTRVKNELNVEAKWFDYRDKEVKDKHQMNLHKRDIMSDGSSSDSEDDTVYSFTH